ncbi:MAG: glycosyltransferase family 9 protein [Alphaproteobacteria bacterium]|nr:glycosyltransferase family 9 protein [Alphaproteobacteria bacterium]MCB9985590.1 glycosyltransferase family 9 protein [Micavibrio sp.]HPQ50976.1 glycosyltransferase family 9 protein [Alphaproteobacteria bacterium]
MVDKILVIKLGALGDFIYSFGAMAAIRLAHPQSHIVLLTTKPFVKMAEASQYFDEIHMDTKPKFWNVAGWLCLRSWLNHQKFSRVYDLQNNDRSSFYLRLMFPRPEWVGAASGSSHRNLSPDRVKGHAFHGHVQTLKLVGIEDVQIDPLEWMTGNIAGYGLKSPYVVLVPGSSLQHPEKRWPVESYRALAGKLIRNGYHPVLLGSDAEAETNEQIARGLDDVVNLTGKTTLFDLPALARGSVGAIGNDTGPMHIMCVTGIPSIVLFCSQKSTIQKHGPQGAQAKAIEAFDLSDVSVSNVLDQFYKLISFIP